MNPYFYLIFVSISISICSICTYVKQIRDSWIYWPIFIISGASLSILWVLATKQLNNTYKIMLFSLIWDIIMILAYYGGPIIYKTIYENQSLNWQIFASIILTITGLIWFKFSTE